jgi:glycosyltransferase involved in cell wall biosynthesis
VIEAIPPPMPRAIESITDRVVYVLHNSLPWSSGGYATRAHGLAVGMASGGLKVICLTRPGYPLDIRQRGPAPAAVPLSETIEGIDYRRISAPRRTETDARGYMLAAADALEAEFRQLRPEWVVAASNHVTGLPALIAARRLGLPFLYEVRGFWEVTRQSREPGFERSETFSVIERLEAETARRADHVFTLTGPMRDELVRRGVDPGTISLLPNSSDPERFTPRDRDAALAARLGIPAPVPVIGYIGTFVQYEGLEDLVAACAVLSGRGRDFRLMLIGNENVSGTDKGPITAEIERIAAETGLTDRLIMPGRVPHEEVAAYYSLIDIAPFPRKPQPVTEMVSPMKPLEALAMEKAVVVSSVAALVEMIADEKTGLVFAKGEVASLADALDRLIGDPGLRARLGRNGRDWVVRERTWSEMGRRARGTLETLAAGTGAGTGAGTPARVPA